MKNKNLALILITALVLSACGNDADKQAEKPNQIENKEEKQATETNTGIKEVKDASKAPKEGEKENLPAVATNVEEALKIFLDHNFGDWSKDAINIDKFKVEFLDNDIIYEIEGFKDGKEYRLKINNNGKILEEKIEDNNDKKFAIDFKKIISGVDAMEKALEGHDENEKVKEYEIKIEEGKAIYDIDLESGEKVKIDAESGEIFEKN